MKAKLVDLLVVLVVLGVLAMPFMYAYAVVSSCGWKGFFVECRITENR